MMSKLLKIVFCLLALSLGGCSRPEPTKAAVLGEMLRARGIKCRAQVVHLDMKTTVKFYIIRLQDISSIKGVPFDALCLSNPQLSDISALSGMQLQFLQIARTSVTNIEPLSGMPLKILDMRDTLVTDLTPLTNVPVEILGVDIDEITNGIDIIRNKKTITLINKKSPERFWKDYDWEREPE